jgi:hypothetical protein
MKVTITRSVDYVLEAPGSDALDCARIAMAHFAALSPEERELHATEIEELWITTGTLESADSQVFTAADLVKPPAVPVVSSK